MGQSIIRCATRQGKKQRKISYVFQTTTYIFNSTYQLPQTSSYRETGQQRCLVKNRSVYKVNIIKESNTTQNYHILFIFN